MKRTDHVAIVTHEHTPGASHAFRDYLLDRKVARVTFIAHPLVNRSSDSYKERYQNGGKIDKKKVSRLWIHPLISYPVDTILTMRWLLFEPPADWYIGVSPLNAVVGILLRSLGRVKRVIFYSIDFTPKRFSSPFLNVLYHALETWSVKNADVCWDVSSRIREGRMRFLGIPAYDREVVPIGIKKRHIATSWTKRRSFRLGFVGHLLEKQGVQLILEALPKIVKAFPDAELLIIGGGEYKEELVTLTKDFHVSNRVIFTDWISDQDKVAGLLSGCVLGLAPYVPDGAGESNFTYWADPTKIKTYLASGLPVIVTDVPYNARELEKTSCAVVIPYDVDALVKKIIDLLSDVKRLTAMRKNAISYARSVTWDAIFRRATGL